MKKYFLFVFVLALLTTGTFALAQTTSTKQIPFNPFLKKATTTSTTTIPKKNTPPKLPEGAVNCFDYYKFGSVYASLETKNYKNSSGTKINFFGEIKNENKYPIADGKLFVKIMRANNSYEKTGGQDEIDSFVVREGISIPANSSVPINFDWQIPSYAISGEYQVSTYFIIDDSFNMSGLSFTTDIVGGVVKFEVVGEQKEGLVFDRNNITLNDKSYYTVAFTPYISSTSTANIVFTLKNETNQTQQVPVILELYEWDSQAKKNLLNTKKTSYLVGAKKSISIPYTVTDTKHSVYYLLAKAQYKDAKSEVSVRFAREGKQEPRINFSTFTQYPFVKGQENSLVTCVHNTNSGNIEYGKVITSVLDHNGKTIYTTTYEGKITGAIQGLLSKFTPSANYKDVKIETKIYDRDNNIIDETSVDYVCLSLSNDCKEPILFFTIKNILVALIVIIIAILIFILKHRFKKKDVIMMFAFVFILSSLFVPSVGEAKSLIWNSGIPVDLTSLDYYNWYDQNESNSGSQVSGVTSQITFFAQVKNLTTSQILSENSTVKIGDVLRFVFGKSDTDFSEDYKDIYWFGAGATWDSPYGDWVNNASTTLVPNKPKYLLSTYVDGNAIDAFVYGQLSVNPPVKMLNSTENLNCGNIDSSGHYIDCIVGSVTATTTITPNFVYGKTYGKYYFMNIPNQASEWDLYNTTLSGTSTLTCLNVNCTQTGYQFKSWDELLQWWSLIGGDDISSLSKFKYYYTASNRPSQFLASPDGGGNTNYSINISTTTIPFSLKILPPVACTSSNTPTTPTIIGPDTTYVNTNNTFSFNPNNATTTYQIDWGDGAGWSSVTNPVDKKWTATGTKSIKVKATNTDSLCFAESATKTVTVTEDPSTVFNTPSLSASNVSCSSITLNWTEESGVSYQLYKKDAGGNFQEVSGATYKPYTDSNLSASTLYSYQLLGTKGGVTHTSTVFSTTTLSTCPCQTTSYSCNGTNQRIDNCGNPVNCPVGQTCSGSPGFAKCSDVNASGSCTLDGFTVGSGTTKIYYNARISKNCDSRTAYCVGNTWRVGPNETDSLYLPSDYKFQKCVTPKASEF